MTITRELIEKFRHHLMEEEKSSATLEKYIRDVTAFFVWLTGHELDKMAVLRYKEHLAVNYAPASVNSVLSSLNSFFSYNEWHKCSEFSDRFLQKGTRNLPGQNTKDYSMQQSTETTKGFIFLCKQYVPAEYESPN